LGTRLVEGSGQAGLALASVANARYRRLAGEAHNRRNRKGIGVHRRFPRGDASGKMNSRFAATLAVRDLAVGEDPLDEALPIAFNRADDARDVRCVEAREPMMEDTRT